MAVPAHFDAEMLSALGRLVRGAHLGVGAVDLALAKLARAPFARYPVAPLLREAWALRENVAQRDALYVALARTLGASLLTCDEQLAGAPRPGIDVLVARR